MSGPAVHRISALPSDFAHKTPTRKPGRWIFWARYSHSRRITASATHPQKLFLLFRALFPLVLLGAIVLTSVFALGSSESGFASTAILFSPQFQTIATHSPEQDYSVYLPIVLRDFPPPPGIFGAEIHHLTDTNLSSASDVKLSWVRNAVFSWADIEPDRQDTPIYQWENVDEAGLIESTKRLMTVVAVVKYTPAWAQKITGVRCGPIHQDALDEFYNFVYAAVKRYSAPPYNIRYWEFGNEPDVDPSIIPPDYPFGCWGDLNDPYYGGGYYAEMLKRAYPAVKAANPNAKVIIGGLLLDCDPENPPPNDRIGCLPAKFFEGILRNEGASYFDIVAFHSYALYYDNHIYDEDHQNWDDRGGQIYGKVNFLRSVMGAYGIDKPILVTETSLSCNGVDCATYSDHFYDLQADFVVSSYARTWGLGLLGSIWYSLEDNGWRESSLFDGSTPKPGYYALRFMSELLAEAKVGGAITEYSGLRGYQFQLPTKKIWILWSPDGVTARQVALPTGTTKIYDKFGNLIEPMPNPVTIIHPTYFEFP